MFSQPDDLLVLFAGEAEERIDHILELIPHIESDSAAMDQVRRELHALKGAGRMMGLERFSELCHEGETIVNGEGQDLVPKMLELMDRLTNRLSEVLDKKKDSSGEPHAETKVHGEPGTRTPGEAVEPHAGGGHATTARIPIARLDELTDRAIRLRVLAVGASALIQRLRDLSHYAETSVSDPEPEQVLATLATSLNRVALELDSGQRKFLHGAERQLEALLGFQLQPLKPFLMRLARHVRELASSLGKKVEVTVEGGKTQLDRRILEVIEEAMVHLIRNAVDHGIEETKSRIEAGKDPTGHISIRASNQAGMVELTVSDDGGGIDRERVLEAARHQGLLKGEDEAALTDSEVFHLLFHPGFTTRSASSEISGRGIGLDAVATAVQRIGGQVWVESAAGKGTTIHILAPVSKRNEKVRILQAGSSLIAVPSASVIGYRSSRRLKRHATTGKPETVEYEGSMVALYRLGDLIGEVSADEGVLVFMKTGGMTLCVAADVAGREEDVLVYPLPSLGGQNLIFDSAVLLASGRPVPVLSPFLLSTHHLQGLKVEKRPQPDVRRIRVLLVDDSRVTREMLRGLLEDAGLSVVAAPTAERALHALKEQEFNCLVTDIEMPGMNGLELTERLRHDRRFSDLPIIVVSTRNTEKDRLAGLNAGADAYVTKQGFDASRLIRLVKQLAR
ncbi:MAG: response regulator [Acidobacteria bacterium]|nr:response regulator [Acidobacteriota bacterium]